MKPRKRNGAPGSVALILLAPQFREGRTVYCMERLREAGISVSMVGLSAGLIAGYHGMAVRPDLTLSQLPETTGHKLLLIPDGKESVAVLFADPRVHQLIKTTVKNEGMVAAMPDAERLIEQAGLVTARSASQFVWKRDGDMKGFVTALIHYLQ